MQRVWGIGVLILFGTFSVFSVFSVAAVDPAQPKPEKMDIRGSLTRVSPEKNPQGKVVGSVSIDGVKEKDTEYDRASVRVTSTTRIFKVVAGKRVAATFEDCKMGARVEARFVGPVAESYPVQATAGVLVILEEPKK